MRRPLLLNFLPVSIVVFLLFSGINGCKEPYISPISKQDLSYLVVDGIITTDNGVATIRLSRTRNLGDSIPDFPEAYASVSLSDYDANVYPFYYAGNGSYVAINLNLNPSLKYQLSIQTNDGKLYVADSLIPKISPPIDSIHYELNKSGVDINVTTHDPTGETRYYRWEYAETWEHHAKFNSLLVYENFQFTVRGKDRQIFKCWVTDTATDILVANSAKLESDLIYQKPILSIPDGDDRISNLYSIIIYQYAISPEAFEYWENLKKITELRGSLFDPQPSQVTGNIRCVTKPDEPVLGFMSISSVSSKRIFIDNDDLAFWNYVYPYECNASIIAPDQYDRFFGNPTLYVPLEQGIAGITGAGTECADCRYTGGITTKPVFFP